MNLLRLLTAAFGPKRKSREVALESEKRTITDIGEPFLPCRLLTPQRLAARIPPHANGADVAFALAA
jgi:hypothetical protein